MYWNIESEKYLLSLHISWIVTLDVLKYRINADKEKSDRVE